MLCKYEGDECESKAERIYVIEGKPIHLCLKHYHLEIEIDAELWEEKHGSFCYECCELVPSFVVRDLSLPCLCEGHLTAKIKLNTFTLEYLWIKDESSIAQHRITRRYFRLPSE